MRNYEYLTSDLRKTFSLWRYWLYSAFISLQQKHAKTSFGILWEPITILFFAVVLSTVWSKVLDVPSPREYFLYLIPGMLVWNLLSGLARSGVATLRRNARNMTLRPLPLTTYVFEDIALGALGFFISLPFVLLIVALLGTLTMQGIAWLTVGLILILIAAVGFGLSFGVAAFHFGDIQPLVQAVMRLGFLVTPIIWKPERLGEYAYLIWLNPFYSFLDVCRRGLLGQQMDYLSLAIALAIATILIIVGSVVFSFNYTSIRKRAFQY